MNYTPDNYWNPILTDDMLITLLESGFGISELVSIYKIKHPVLFEKKVHKLLWEVSREVKKLKKVS